MGSITPTHLKVVVTITRSHWRLHWKPCKSTRRGFLISVNHISRAKAGGSPVNKHGACKLLQGLSSKQDAKILSSFIGMVMQYPLPHCQKSLKEISLRILLKLKSVPLLHLLFHLAEVVLCFPHLIWCVMVVLSTPEVVAFHQWAQ